ncbi:MAG TPA: peptidase M28 family protein, partial [Planctomycetota bacterium]|nr:peptidase M28 family protein [Planctomycetota bacterium]
DIAPMAGAGVPLVGFRPDDERYFAYHHTHSDTLDKVSRRELDLGAGAIAALLYVVADLTDPLPRNTASASR